MLSGIGPGAHLFEHGIDCRVDLQGVGKNLIDHPEVPMTALANGPYGYYKQGEGWRMIKNGLQFKLAQLPNRQGCRVEPGRRDDRSDGAQSTNQCKTDDDHFACIADCRSISEQCVC